VIFFPGIAFHVIAAGFPVARDILIHDGNMADPLSTFPKIKFRKNNPNRATMFVAYWLPFPAMGKQDIIIVKLF